MPLPNDLFSQIKAKGGESDEAPTKTSNNAMLAQLLSNKQPQPPKIVQAAVASTTESKEQEATATDFNGQSFVYDESKDSFLFAVHHDSKSSQRKPHLNEPCLIPDLYGNENTNIMIPLAPCVYRMTDYTYLKKEPILLYRCIHKLGVLRCLQRECTTINTLLWNRYHNGSSTIPMEEDEIGKIRFMELLSNCGIYQKVSELLMKQITNAIDCIKNASKKGGGPSLLNLNPYMVPQLQVDGLNELLSMIDTVSPSLQVARNEIEQTQTVSFYPGLGELFTPGSKLTCYPDGMEGTPLGCQVVQCWYDEELNKATQKMKRRFLLIVEFIVSVGEELVFVAASDVYPEFHDPNRNIPIKDLTHRKLLPKLNKDDASLLQCLQLRGEFYASVATKNHYLEYQSNSFYPIIGGGWSNHAVRPLSKGGRIMVDVKRGILEGHIPIRVSSHSASGGADGMSDTVKEAIKLFEQSKRTGVAVPFRTCILPGFDSFQSKGNISHSGVNENSDRPHLWQAWPMLTGFSFTARVWGKLLLAMPKPKAQQPMDDANERDDGRDDLVRRPSIRKFGGAIEVGGLGGAGKCGNCGYIKFQEQAFDQLVLADDKKELIRAVARNAGGGTKFDGGKDDDDDDYDDDGDDDDDDDDDEVGIDVVANKGGASIFLLHGPPGTGKTLTAEAIAELLRKPLYVVTAGDLGITASEVEKTLGSVLELCQTWDALVLIDEADIFLEARNSHEIQRNALVCVMLRLLEYYSGCLFLSSNRSASSIDAAIASRITVMLSYPQLDVDGRAKVWKNLLELIPLAPSTIVKKASKYRTEFSQDDYNTLANGFDLNGRQIKNSIVLGRALARERNMPLSMTIIGRAVTAVAGEGASIKKSDNAGTY